MLTTRTIIPEISLCRRRAAIRPAERPAVRTELQGRPSRLHRTCVAAFVLIWVMANGPGVFGAALPVQDAETQMSRAAAAAMAERSNFIQQLADGSLVSTDPVHYETAIEWQQEIIAEAIEAQQFADVARLADGIEILEQKLESVRLLLDYTEQMRVANEVGAFGQVAELARLARAVRESLDPSPGETLATPVARGAESVPTPLVPESPGPPGTDSTAGLQAGRPTPEDAAALDRLRGALPQPLLPSGGGNADQGGLGRILLEDGVEGLRLAMSEVEVPALTFNQETQVRTVQNSHVRVLEDMLAGSGGNFSSIEAEVRALEEQLLLATLKFLNPAQRTGLIGATASAAFAELNSDLPEDEAELLEYLTDLRSPAGTEEISTDSGGGGFGGGGGGGGGGGLIIDGFSGGRMPNRDEIQEIRINENSFTAEQSNQTRGRTEVITRGGVGRFNGDFTFNFGDESLDSRNAFASSRPPYQQRNFSANLSGPVILNRLTMTFSLRNNNSETGETLRALTPDGLIDDPVVQPTVQRSYTTRGTLQLSQNHNLNTSYDFGSQNSTNQNVGELGLPEQASTNSRDNFTYQIKETAVLSSRFNNEVRFQYSGNRIQQLRVNDAPHIDVLGAFRAGGAAGNRDTELRSYDFGNLLMYTGNSWAFRFGYDGGFTRIDSDTQNNFNGTFTFNSLYDYCGVALGGFTAPQCQIELAENPGVPLTGPTYSISAGTPVFLVNQWQSAMYVQSDWRATPRFTLSLGTRYEWQTNLEDSNNFDPRLGFAYSLGSNTVLRGGTGTFHQRLAFFSALDLIRNDGTNQQTFEISEVVPFIDFTVNPLQSSSGAAFLVPTSRRVRAPELVAPYTWNNELSIETSLSGGLVLTGSYRFIRGIHLFRDRNLNAPFDSTSPIIRSCFQGLPAGACIRPDPTEGNVNQYESTATSSSHTFRIGVRQRFSFLNLNGSYDFDSTYDDLAGTGGGNFGGNNIRLPADNYDLDSEWGRSGARHRANFSASFRLPWDINAATIFDWSTGSPYTHLTGADDNLDTTRNDRPAGVAKNTLDGPGFFETSLDFSKAIQLRSEQVEVAGAGLGTGGFYGQRTGLRMTISANVTNLLNNVNFQSFNGVETSRFFMLPTRARNPRQMTLSVRFDF